MNSRTPYIAAVGFAVLLFLSLLLFGRSRPNTTLAAEKTRSIQGDAISADDMHASANAPITS